MRAWALGQAVLVVDVALAAGIGLSQRQPGTTQTPLFVLAGALVFFVPLVLALALRTIRTRAAFWAASILPAIVWIPAIPAAFLRGGPALATPSGLGLAAVAIGGAVLVTVGGTLAAIEAARAAPAAAVVTADGPVEEASITAGSVEDEPIETADAAVEAANVVAPDIATPTGSDELTESSEAPEAIGSIEPSPAPQPDEPPADTRTADDELVAELVREPGTNRAESGEADLVPTETGTDRSDASERAADTTDA
jgi:hypothetical protein